MAILLLGKMNTKSLTYKHTYNLWISASQETKALADYNEHIAMLDEKVKKFMAEIDADKQQAHKAYCEVFSSLEKTTAYSL